ELAIIKRMYTLAIRGGRLLPSHRPYVPMLQEHNVRTGFFEVEQFASVKAHLPAALQAVAEFAYLTGWRVRSEILPLEWRQVDFRAGTVSLDPGTTKNGEGRTIFMTKALRELLEEQRTATKTLQDTENRIVPHVFHRAGKPIRDFYAAWRSACKAAGLPGRLLHDFRRTAVRNWVRAGIPERVAMQMSGHLTRSVFERYNVVSSGDLKAAAALLDANAQCHSQHTAAHRSS
ncbi:MAG: site-specific integrase, partial [Vicinamibacterales bacterium]